MARFVCNELLPLYDNPPTRVPANLIGARVGSCRGTIPYNGQLIGDTFEFGRIPFGGYPLLAMLYPGASGGSSTMAFGYDAASLGTCLRGGLTFVSVSTISLSAFALQPIGDTFTIPGTGTFAMPPDVRSIGAKIIGTLGAANMPAASAAGVLVVDFLFVEPS